MQKLTSNKASIYTYTYKWLDCFENVKFLQSSAGNVFFDPGLPLLTGLVIEELSPAPHLPSPHKVRLTRREVHPGSGVGVGVLLHVGELDVLSQVFLLLGGQGVIEEGTKIIDDAQLIFLHVFVPEKLQVGMISPFPTLEQVMPVGSVNQKTFFEKLSELWPVPFVVVTRNEDVMVVIRDRGIPGISADIHHLAPLQQAGGQKLEGKVGLDDTASCQAVGVTDRIVKHLAELLVVGAETQGSEELSVDETVGLQEGTADHLGNFGLLNVHLIDESPDQFNCPGGACLRVTHYEDVVVSQLEIGNPFTSLGLLQTRKLSKWDFKCRA